MRPATHTPASSHIHQKPVPAAITAANTAAPTLAAVEVTSLKLIYFPFVRFPWRLRTQTAGFRCLLHVHAAAAAPPWWRRQSAAAAGAAGPPPQHRCYSALAARWDEACCVEFQATPPPAQWRSRRSTAGVPQLRICRRTRLLAARLGVAAMIGCAVSRGCATATAPAELRPALGAVAGCASAAMPAYFRRGLAAVTLTLPQPSLPLTGREPHRSPSMPLRAKTWPA